MSSENPELPETQQMSAADFRTEIVKVLGARVAYGAEHIQVMRYKEAQAVVVPVEWYERACRALGEESRLGEASPPATA
ncbi:hypothetical protein [Streptomyces sp. NPDC088762]|uniref:hypothetical protein n=1 Tax=Streptomyces sp. NPDC088762 TaxID=3365891 RepID=UPI0037FF618D